MTSFGRLRDVGEDEIDLVRSWRNAPNVRANMYTRHEISDAEHHAWWARVRSDPKFVYLMFENAGVPLGIVGFSAIDQESRNASWAFYAAPDAPKGTGSRMEFLALDFAFGRLGLHKLYCEVLAFNVAVLALHQKFGFKTEGIFREQHRVEEAFVDIHRLGLLSVEWAAVRPSMLARLQSLGTN